MKRLKISMFAVFAIVLGIAASAFTARTANVPSKTPLTVTWFKFMGSDPTNLSQVQNSANYSYVDGQPCSGSNLICAVNTNGTATSGHQPDPFSSALKSELQNVINNGSSYSDISKRQ